MIADPILYPRRVLLAVVGLTPQVVTETLYALLVRRSPAFVPTALRLVTTEEGAERIGLQLCDREAGALPAFARDYAPQLEQVFADMTVEVLTTKDGRLLSDIQSDSDGLDAADHILQVVRDATADPDAAICASIAGGRKTMGFLLGYAMSLFGRPQDRLTHVLVTPAFQDHPSFFYPPPEPRVLFLPRDNRPIRTDAARVTLTDIPFVRLRSGLPHRLLEGTASFAETVAEAQSALAPAELMLDIPDRTMRCGDRPVILPPVEFAFVLWLVRRRLDGKPQAGAVSWRDADASEFLAAYAELKDVREGDRNRVAGALRDGITAEWFEQRVTRINKFLDGALGLVAPLYSIVGTGRRPNTRYGLPAQLTSITLREGGADT